MRPWRSRRRRCWWPGWAELLAVLTVLPGAGVLAVAVGGVAAALWLAFLWVDRAAFAVDRFHVGGLA